MLNARQAEFRNQHDLEQLDHIKFLSAPVGSGKTEAVINDIRDNLEQSYLFVAPTRILGQDVKSRMDAALVNHRQGQNVHLEISEDDNPRSVIERVLNRINGKLSNQHHVLIITTETFRNLLPIMRDEQKADYTVYMDEGIEPVEYVEFRTQQHNIYLEPVHQEEDGTFSIAPNGRQLLENVARNPNRVRAIGREELLTEGYRKIAKLMVSGIHDVYGTVGEQSIRVVAFLRPDLFLSFQSVVIIRAIFEQSLLALFWREKYGIRFREYETSGELFNTHVEKGPLMRLHYLLHDGDHTSRQNFERHFETGELHQPERDGQRVIDRMAEIVSQEFADVPYCWAAGTHFNNLDQHLDPNTRMPVESAGLNDFQRNDVVISLISGNPPPWVKGMVVDQVDITDNEFYELWKLSSTYQTIGRCSLRVRDANKEIDTVVPSRDLAARISALFPGSQIVGQLGIPPLPRYRAMRKGRGPARNGVRFSHADTQAWYRFRQSHPDTPLSREEWYSEVCNRGSQE